MDTAFSEQLPILGTLTNCQHTPTGWRGVDPEGFVCDVTYRPGTGGDLPARMPDNNRVTAIDENGRKIGVWLLERKRTRTRGRVHS